MPEPDLPEPEGVRTVEVDTPQGPGRLHVSTPAGAGVEPRAVLLLGHGAGGGVEGVDLRALATHLPVLGVAVVRHEQPWRVSGRRIAVRPALLDEAWLPAVDAVTQLFPALPLVLGGHSAGARVACRTAPLLQERGTAVRGLVALSFPLHPPRNAERSRAGELLGCGRPVLVLQGERDPFGPDAEVRAAVAGESTIEVLGVPTAAHDLRLRRASGTTTAGWWAAAAPTVARFVLGR